VRSSWLQLALVEILQINYCPYYQWVAIGSIETAAQQEQQGVQQQQQEAPAAAANVWEPSKAS
jgi:hypothetical protein